MAVPDRGPGTGTNYEKRVSGTRNSVWKFQPGKRGHLLDFPLSLGIFQWDEPTKRVPFTAEREIPEILTKWPWKAPVMRLYNILQTPAVSLLSV